MVAGVGRGTLVTLYAQSRAKSEQKWGWDMKSPGPLSRAYFFRESPPPKGYTSFPIAHQLGTECSNLCACGDMSPSQRNTGLSKKQQQQK